MNTYTLINAVLNYVDNIDGNDSENANRRLRLLQYAQETVDEVWNSGEYTFKITGPAELTVPAWVSGTPPTPSKAALPTDFGTFGKIGKVFNKSTGKELSEISMTEMVQLFLGATSATTSDPDVFAIMGDVGDNATAATPAPYFLYTPNLCAATTLLYYYQTCPPTLADATGNTNNLYKIPVSYHNTVILPGVAAKCARSKGDPRDWYAEYKMGLATMKSKETPRRSSTQRLPRAISGKW